MRCDVFDLDEVLQNAGTVATIDEFEVGRRSQLCTPAFNCWLSE